MWNFFAPGWPNKADGAKAKIVYEDKRTNREETTPPLFAIGECHFQV